MTIFQLLIPESIGLKSIICIFVICKRPKAYCALLKDADAQTPRHHPAVWSWRGSCRIKERLAAQQAQLWGARGLDSREKSFIFKEFRPKAKKKFQLVCRPQMSMWDQGEKLWMDDQHLTRCTWRLFANHLGPLRNFTAHPQIWFDSLTLVKDFWL